jgi:hypothetical protein
MMQSDGDFCLVGEVGIGSAMAAPVSENSPQTGNFDGRGTSVHKRQLDADDVPRLVQRALDDDVTGGDSAVQLA